MRFVEAKSKCLLDLLKSSSYFKIAGLDIGTRYCGVAISDETRVFVGPAKDIPRKYKPLSKEDVQYFSAALSRLVVENNIKAFVVGLPIYNNQLTPFCKEIIDLMLQTEISPRLSSPPSTESDKSEIVFTCWDESESSVHARLLTRQFSNKRSVINKQKDGLAAGVILHSFLQHVNPQPSM